jgi:hypothetical protein
MNEVESQEAELAEWKCEVMTGWEDARMVPSKQAMRWVRRICEKTSQKRVRDRPLRKGAEAGLCRGGEGGR